MQFSITSGKVFTLNSRTYSDLTTEIGGFEIATHKKELSLPVMEGVQTTTSGTTQLLDQVVAEFKVFH